MNRREDDAYDFEFVDYNKRNPDDYLTISSRGVTHFHYGTAEFLTLAEWDREYRLYRQIKELKFFKLYKSWKNYSLWKNMRRRSMMAKHEKTLTNDLFILDKTLADAILDIRGQTFRIMRWDLVDLNFEEVRSLEKFNVDQNKKRESLASQLEDIEIHIKDIAVECCKESMRQFQKENRTNLHNEETGEAANNSEEEPQDSFLVGDNTNKQMPYTQVAIIRTHYARL